MYPGKFSRESQARPCGVEKRMIGSLSWRNPSFFPSTLGVLTSALLLLLAGVPAEGRAQDLAALANAAAVQTVTPDRPAVPCPAQTARTMVILVVGQSHAANHTAVRSASRRGAYVLFDGRCYPAADPLPGGTGTSGSLWPGLGDHLLETNSADAVVFAVAAVSGTSLRRWAPGGELAGLLSAVVRSVVPRYRVTHTLWMQGESDLVEGTDTATYRDRFHALLGSLRQLGVAAPVYVAVSSSWCGPVIGRLVSRSNPVAEAQRALVDPKAGILAGPEVDTLVDARGRYDGCHFSPQGVAALVQAWSAVLERPVPAQH